MIEKRRGLESIKNHAGRDWDGVVPRRARRHSLIVDGSRLPFGAGSGSEYWLMQDETDMRATVMRPFFRIQWRLFEYICSVSCHTLPPQIMPSLCVVAVSRQQGGPTSAALTNGRRVETSAAGSLEWKSQIGPYLLVLIVVKKLAVVHCLAQEVLAIMVLTWLLFSPFSLHVVDFNVTFDSKLICSYR